MESNLQGRPAVSNDELVEGKRKNIPFLKRENLGFVFIAIGLLVFFIFSIFGNFIIIPGKFDPETLSKYGGFMGGTVGSIFTLAGFLLIFESFRLQKKQFFENTFFSLFVQFNDFRYNHIALIDDENGDDVTVRGSDFFEDIFERGLGLNSFGKKTTEAKIASIYRLHKSHIGRFFGHINIIVYFIEENSQLKMSEKNFYYSYIISQLSDQEMFLLHYYKLHENAVHLPYLKHIVKTDTTDYSKYVE